MKNTAEMPPFARLEIAERNAHESALLRAEAQTEAARQLLEEATANGQDTELWRAALDFAESHEAQARRSFAQWQQRDRAAAFKTHEFARLLFRATAKKLEELENPPCKTKRPRQTSAKPSPC